MRKLTSSRVRFPFPSRRRMERSCQHRRQRLLQRGFEQLESRQMLALTDYKAAIIHELTHELGFLSGITQSGEDDYNDLPGAPGSDSITTSSWRTAPAR